MAYQKLQAGKAWSVYPSDNTDIPNVGKGGPSGTTTGTGGANKYLVDAGRTGTDPENFATLKFTLSGIKPGMIVVNSSDGLQSEVVRVVSDTQVEVKEAIFTASPKNYAIYGGTQEGAVLYIGGAGNLQVTTVAGDTVTFNGLQAGTFFPVNVVKVFSSGTSATNIVALW
tara:strand:- start:380 stop:889 length:510 start_codon:yes stop_codon:yes gene_type:complete